MKKKTSNRYYHISSKKPRFEASPTQQSAGRGCLFIEGEPKDRNFCGAPAVRTGSGSWCARHVPVVYERTTGGFGQKAKTV